MMQPTVNNIKELARHISEKSEIKGQYYQIGSLFLVSETLNPDANNYWEYSIYKTDDEGNAYLFENYTVNSSSDNGESFAQFLLQNEKVSYESFVDPHTHKNVWKDHTDKIIRASRVEKYKRYFDQMKHLV